MTLEEFAEQVADVLRKRMGDADVVEISSAHLYEPGKVEITVETFDNQQFVLTAECG